MRKHLLLAIAMMAVCALGIAALQAFYSWQSYQTEQRTFSRNVNEAFAVAVDSAMLVRTDEISEEFRSWISDTSFVRVTSRVNEIYGTTVFTLTETGPQSKGQKSISMSLENFTAKVEPITPEARKIFIDHMVRIARKDLRKGFVFFYTQKLGDRLDKAYFSIPVDTAIVRREFVKQLSKRQIAVDFTLKPIPKTEGLFQTEKQNLERKDLKKPRWIWATCYNSGFFVFQKLKWAIGGSVVLVLLTLFCFGYVLRLLLTQHKLSVIKDDFIRNMTHEIHTPLASLTVTAEALQRFDHDAPKRQEYLQILLHQLEKLGKLTNEIIKTAKSGTSGKETRKPVSIRSVLEDLIADFPSVFFTVVVPEDICVSANPTGLHRAFANLIDNAVKYNDKPKVEIRIIASETKRDVVIGISDNGPGIPISEKNNIFDAFYRIPTGDRHDVKGFGLGLHYVRKTIESLGGTIELAGSETGATFHIKIPK